MAGDNYCIRDQHAKHFLTLTVINWIDAFSRNEHQSSSFVTRTHNKGDFIAIFKLKNRSISF